MNQALLEGLGTRLYLWYVALANSAALVAVALAQVMQAFFIIRPLLIPSNSPFHGKAQGIQLSSRAHGGGGGGTFHSNHSHTSLWKSCNFCSSHAEFFLSTFSYISASWVEGRQVKE